MRQDTGYPVLSNAMSNGNAGARQHYPVVTKSLMRNASRIFWAHVSPRIRSVPSPSPTTCSDPSPSNSNHRHHCHNCTSHLRLCRWLAAGFSAASPLRFRCRRWAGSPPRKFRPAAAPAPLAAAAAAHRPRLICPPGSRLPQLVACRPVALN